MSFISPWLLWLLFAASIPIIIHLVNRWRHRSVKWAAMEFLLRAAKETRGAKKLLHYIILALRCLALAALIMAFARPLLGNFFGWGSSGLSEVLLVLDRSASMGTRPDKTTSLQKRIPPMIEATFERLPGTKLALLDSLSGTITQIPAPDTLKDMNASKNTDAAANIPSLLEKALPYLQSESTGKTEIWIASDMQKSSWRPDSPLWSGLRQRLSELPMAPDIRIMALRDRPQLNRGLRIKQAQVNNGKLLLVMEVQRQGYDPNQPEEIPVEISVNNASSTHSLNVAGENSAIHKELPLPDGKDTGFGYITLPHDDYTGDDSVFFTFAPKPTAGILVNGPADETAKVLSTMAAPPGLPGRKLATAEDLQQGKVNLNSQALIIWHGPLPYDESAKRLKAYIEQGGLVLFLPDDRTGAGRREFLGVSWEVLETAETDKYFLLKTWERNHGYLQDGTDRKPIPAGRVRAIRRKQLAGQYNVVASWDDGSCAVGQVRVGAGSAIFLTTLPKYSWSNLADGHMLLPLIQRMANRGAERFADAITLWVNSEALPQSASEVPARMDDAMGAAPDGTPEDTAGVYRLGTQTYAVNRPWSEDNPEQLSDEDIAKLLPNATVSAMQNSVDSNSLVQEGWQLFLLIALACLLLEALLCLPGKYAKRQAPLSRS